VHPFSKYSVATNSQINWVDPNATAATLDGQPWVYPALAAEAKDLGVPKVSADNLIDLTLLHELSHYKGAVGNPDKINVERQLWDNCIN
jgi:hypothetical protein